MSQDPYDKARNTLTELQSVTPPFLAADGQVMTVRIEYPPRRSRHPAAPPPRRAVFRLHPGGRNGLRGPGRTAASGEDWRGILGTRRRRHPLPGRQQPHRHPAALRRDDDHGSRPADARLLRPRGAQAERLGTAVTRLRQRIPGMTSDHIQPRTDSSAIISPIAVAAGVLARYGLALPSSRWWPTVR